MPPPIQIDASLVEHYILELARHGAYGETGVWRTVYSPEWVAAGEQYATWCEEAGLAVRRDPVGNIWGRLEGNAGGRAIVSGSHLDSQRPGGRYDGALGAIAALVAIRALHEQFGQPRRPLEALAFCEEEGSRFPAARFWGSRAITGAIAPGEAESLRGYEGESMAEAMRAVGLDPAHIGEARRNDIDSFLELHIEQGPILEQARLPVGVVNAITGLRHYVVEVQGTANHAGAFPMDLRRDPMAGAAEMIGRAIQTATDWGRPAVTTVGRIAAQPNFPAIVPEQVAFTIDARHPDPQALQQLYATHEQMLQAVAKRRGLRVDWRVTLEHPPCLSDPQLVALLEGEARALGIPSTTLHSGAGHDSQVMASCCKVAMIFVQSKDGRSHTPAEFSSVEHAVAGIRLLAAALYRLAYDR
jgi:allantoate deiminase